MHAYGSQCPLAHARVYVYMHLSTTNPSLGFTRSNTSRDQTTKVSPPSSSRPFDIGAPALLGLSTVTCLLGFLDASSVGLGTGGFTSQRFHQSTTGLEWSCEIAFGLFTPNVEFGRVRLEYRLERHERLDEQGLGVLHVSVLQELSALRDRILADTEG